jgi:uncharacterized membrane protein
MGDLWTDYNAGDLLWLGDWGGVWVLGLLALGIVVMALSAYDLRPMPPARRRTLLALRASVYVLAVLMLLEPALDLKNITKVKNEVVVLVDKSRSMELPAASGEGRREELAAQALPGFAGLIERTRGEHTFTFMGYGGEELEVGSPEELGASASEGATSDLLGALEAVRERYAGKELGGVVVMGDGIDTGALGRRTRRGEELDETSRAALEALGAPVNTVSTGRAEGLRDVAVARVLHDDFAFVHNSVTVEAQIQTIGVEEGTALTVELRREGALVATRQVVVSGEEARRKVTFEFVPKRIGKEIYTVSVPELVGEALTENNAGHFLLKVIRDKVRVLQVVGRPSWDERFLRRLLKKDPNVDLISFFILRTNSNVQTVPQQELSLIPFPTRELFDSELGSFDLVILQNFNYGPYDMRQYLPRIREFVREQGGGLAMIGGDLSFASGGYEGTPVEELLPVELPPGRRAEELIDLGAFRPELTDAGQRHPITQLAFDPETNRAIWAGLPEQHGTNIVEGIKAWGTPLLVHPRLRKRGEPMPVLTVGESGRGRVMAWTTDNTWRWGFESLGSGGTPREYQTFWNGAIRWLIKDPELKLVKVELGEDLFSPGEEVPVVVRVSRPDYAPAVGKKGTLVVTYRGLDQLVGGEGSRERVLEQEFETGETGQASVTLKVDRPGVYEVDARVEGEAGELRDQDTILVVEDVEEWRDIIPREELLASMARASGGAHQVAERFSAGALELDEPRAVKINRRKVIQLWDSFVVFVVLLALLGTEWTLRRRWGRL